MLSQEVWNALQENGRREYAPYIGKRIKDTESGKIGVCVSYTLSGQLYVETESGELFTQWLEKCEILED